MVYLFWSLIVFIFLFIGRTSGYGITISNNCGFTIWPGISGSPDLNITGFELPAGNRRTMDAPDFWQGQIWGRIGCNFNGSGHGSCATGDCGSGEMECKGRNYTPPVTIADFRFNGSWSHYNVSVLKGYNVQMMVESVGEFGICKKKGCAQDLNRECLDELKLEGGEGCMSPCQAYPSRDYCCSISSTELASCKPTFYTSWFKSACPTSRVMISEMDIEQDCRANDYAVTFCPPADSFSTIKLGRPLNSGDQLVSIHGNFTLGFFYNDNNVYYSDNYVYYLGIWYTNDAASRKVWVANPNKPITTFSDSTPTMSVEVDPNTGNLVITVEGKTLMNITDVQAGPNPNVTATLEESGNFRLINEVNKRVLWQSFDHPTNVLLPGMKLGSNLTTGQNWTLTSWLSDYIPDSGAFTLSWERIDEASQGLMIRQRSQAYWTSGFLDVKTFEYLFLLYGDGQSKYIITSVYNYKEQYFSYIDNPDYHDTNDPFPMWILTSKGQLSNYNISDIWTPELCYGYNSSNGCIESSSPQCRTENDYFSYLSGEFVLDKTTNSTDSNLSLSISDCFVKCWNDCNCVGFDSYHYNGTGCVIWTGSNSFITITYYYSSKYVIRSQNPANPNTGNGMKKIWTVTGVVIPLVFLCLGLVWCTMKRKQSREDDCADEVSSF